jgi:hypothetical protein
MLWHCDTLTLGPASPKFKDLTGHVDFHKVREDYVFELAVLLATPGVRELDVRNWFRRRISPFFMRWVVKLDLNVGSLARENAASVVEADAWAMLALTPRNSRPGVYGRALIQQYGFGPAARRVGVSEAVVRRWSATSASLVL